MLLLDEAAFHLMADVCQFLSYWGTEVEYIPASYTNKMQPMDVGMNKPFKDGMQVCVEEFLVKQRVNMKQNQKDISHWINKSWNGIGDNVLLNTLKDIGVTICSRRCSSNGEAYEQTGRQRHG